jgi:hypothetical protein
MITIHPQAKVMFSTVKGTVKVGTVITTRHRLIQDEYEDVFVIETEEGKLYQVDESHIIQILS